MLENLFMQEKYKVVYSEVRTGWISMTVAAEGCTWEKERVMFTFVDCYETLCFLLSDIKIHCLLLLSEQHNSGLEKNGCKI